MKKTLVKVADDQAAKPKGLPAGANFSDVPKGKSVFVRLTNANVRQIPLDDFADYVPWRVGTISLVEASFIGVTTTGGTPTYVQLLLEFPGEDIRVVSEPATLRSGAIPLVRRANPVAAAPVLDYEFQFIYSPPRLVHTSFQGFRPKWLKVGVHDPSTFAFTFTDLFVELLLSPL